jgi:hypothetical protein
LRRSGAVTLAILAALLAFAAPRSARAAGGDTAAHPSPSSVAAARQHFERAQELYKNGAYRESIAELEAARSLDPTAKELVFNLGVVHEKLAEIDEALRFMHVYTQMNLTDVERAKAEAYIQRLEGAKREMAGRTAHPGPGLVEPPPAHESSPPQPPEPDTVEPPEKSKGGHGRLDGATVTALVIGAAGLGFGTFFGFRAISDRPSGYTYQPSTFGGFTAQNDQAHKEAIVADVCLGVGAAGALTAVLLYALRTKDAAPPPVTAVLANGGGGMVWRGTF